MMLLFLLLILLLIYHHPLCSTSYSPFPISPISHPVPPQPCLPLPPYSSSPSSTFCLLFLPPLSYFSILLLPLPPSPHLPSPLLPILPFLLLPIVLYLLPPTFPPAPHQSFSVAPHRALPTY